MDLYNSAAFTRRAFLGRGLTLASAALAVPAFLQDTALALPHPRTAAPATLRLTRRLLANTLFRLSYSAEQQTLLPLFLHRAAAGAKRNGALSPNKRAARPSSQEQEPGPRREDTHPSSRVCNEEDAAPCLYSETRRLFVSLTAPLRTTRSQGMDPRSEPVRWRAHPPNPRTPSRCRHQRR